MAGGPAVWESEGAHHHVETVCLVTECARRPTDLRRLALHGARLDEAFPFSGGPTRRARSAAATFARRRYYRSRRRRFDRLGSFYSCRGFHLLGRMAIGYFMAHAPKSFWPALNQGDAAILFTFVFLYLAFAGPGTWSLDAIFRKSSASAPQPDVAGLFR